ncbi:alpha/beta fold hydrolase [Antrihabitans stalactiti]|uniref:Alpha/beta hydrolase n=1 Tax=Antrihabitans stalactiti TaxID=2584121 RepID=A0A848KA80_9NOCA|nr:alpha/beta hydrolase [Antrihabitans stalactiti]NMN94164.1 alpha/beta hydrolase [Antrihabitans stalactiti]
MSGPLRRVGEAALASGALVAGGITGRSLYQRRRKAVRDIRAVGRGGGEGKVVTADGTKLHVEIDGPPTAPLTVVVAHGFFMDLTTWRYQRTALSDSPAKIVYYDHRGYGKSEPGPPGVASIRQLAEDMYEVIEAVAPTGPVVVVGHSMGSFTIQALAGLHPELFGPRIVTSVLISTAAEGSVLVRTLLRELPFAGKVMSPTASVLDIVATLRPFLVRAFGLGMYRPFGFLFVDRRSPAQARREFLAVISAAHLDVMSEYLTALAAHDELTSLPALGNARTVIVTGERDLVVPLQLSEAVAAEIPGAEHIVIEGSGHIVTFERADEVSELLIDVIDADAAAAASTHRAGA